MSSASVSCYTQNTCNNLPTYSDEHKPSKTAAGKNLRILSVYNKRRVSTPLAVFSRNALYKSTFYLLYLPLHASIA